MIDARESSVLPYLFHMYFESKAERFVQDKLNTCSLTPTLIDAKLLPQAFSSKRASRLPSRELKLLHNSNHEIIFLNCLAVSITSVAA